MDSVTFLDQAWGVLVFAAGFVWMLLTLMFGIPIIGGFLEVGFYVGLAYLAYTYSPHWMRSLLRTRILPSTGAAARPLRWMLVRWIADPEWLRQKSDTPSRVITREVHVRRPLWRTRMRWFLFGIFVTLVILYRALWWHLVMQ